MSTMSKKVVAIVCSDLHLSLRPPIARAGEPDWFVAMKRPLDEIKKLSTEYDCPVLCAGDIFDHWRSPPELINFAIKELPHMYAIPGQHDLPMHSISEAHKSAFWTLVEADKITWVPPVGNFEIPGMDLYGFAWGQTVGKPPPIGKRDTLKVALVHRYTWMPECGYKDALQADLITIPLQRQEYKGYNVAIIGDNHIPWDYRLENTNIFNCGSLYNRKSDETHRPSVGLLKSDGSIERYHLDNSWIKFNASSIQDHTSTNLDGLLAELQGLQSAALDYNAALKRVLDRGVAPEIQWIILEALEHGKPL